MANENFTEQQAHSYMEKLLPTLDYWKKVEKLSDNDNLKGLKSC